MGHGCASTPCPHLIPAPVITPRLHSWFVPYARDSLNCRQSNLFRGLSAFCSPLLLSLS